MAITTLNNRSINRSDTASAGQLWTATSATASDFQASSAASTPAFFASISSNQTVGTASATKLSINAEEFDSGVYDNSTNYRFTPGVAGKFFIFANGYINSLTNAKTVVIYIYKNGASIATGRNVAGKTGAVLTTYTSIIDTADDDDYYEVYLYHDEGGDLTVPGSSEARSYFGAFKIIGA